MLVFRSVCPINNNASIQNLIDVSIEWIDKSPSYKMRGMLSEYYGKNEFSVKLDSEQIECFSCAFDGNNYACIFFENCEVDKKWTTQIVYQKNENKFLFSINIYCEVIDFVNVLNEVNKPYIFKIIDDKIGFGKDYDIETTCKPYFFKSSELDFAENIIMGKFNSYLPCVYISMNQYGEYSIDIESLSKLLSGIAHVFVEPNVYFARDLRVKTDGKNPYMGAIGIFFPNSTNRKIILPKFEFGYRIKIRNMFNAVKNSLNFGFQPEELSYSDIKTRVMKLKFQDKAKENDTQSMLDYAISENIEHEATIKRQKDEIYHLQMRLQAIENTADDSLNSLLSMGKEVDSYQFQIRDTIIELIEGCKNGFNEGTRKRNIIEDVLKHNKKSGSKQHLVEELKQVLKGYSTMTGSIESSLKRLGFDVDKTSPHYKLYFADYPQIFVPLPASGSDSRGGLNCVSDINKSLL